MRTIGFTLFLMIFIGLTGCVSDDQTPDPVLQDYPIAYVKRPLYDVDNDPIPLDGRDWLTFRAGGDLFLRDRASPSAAEKNITSRFTQGLGDVRDVEISYDGSKLLFSMRAPEIDGVPDNQQPTWNIWEYHLETDQLTRIINSNITAEQGQDVAPAYLPDGRIVFSSTRQQESGRLLLDEGKSQYASLEESLDEQAAVLHVMEADGSNIRQISFNMSHDYDPTVLMDGRILFSRWDNTGNRNDVRLYTVRPDGTQLQIYYGAHSDRARSDGSRSDPLQVRQMEDGRLVSTQVLRNQNNRGGDLLIIDPRYIDHDQPTENYRGVLDGPGQYSATVFNVRLDDDLPSSGGHFLSAFPLWDGSTRVLTSWSPCRLIIDGRIEPCREPALSSADSVEADPLFGVYVYNFADHTQRPVVIGEEGFLIGDVVTMRERPYPTVIYDSHPDDGVIDKTLHDQNMGLLHIRSIYDRDGADTASPDIATVADPDQTTASQRQARYIRIEKAVAIPDEDTLDFDRGAFGRSNQNTMREILGYAMVEPDGSVMVEVPANLAFTISILDQNGRRIHNRHLNWLQLRPGEQLYCHGCHDHNSGLPHGHPEGPAAIYAGAATSGAPFPNTDPTMIANITETMAQTRSRISCLTDCSARELSVNLTFSDHWAITPEPDTSNLYSDLDPTLTAPVSTQCQTSWQPLCRTVINYPDHIHPLWDLPRQDASMNDVSCTNCHTDRDAMGALQVPEAQLQLDGGASPENALHLISYRELLFADDAQELLNGALQDQLVQDTDGDGNPIFVDDGNGNLVPVLVTVDAPGPSMSVNGANSSYFLSLFESGGVHPGWLSPEELRLISEWLDLGAQYYNNPFLVP